MRFLLTVVILCITLWPYHTTGRPVTLLDLTYDLTDGIPVFGEQTFKLQKKPNINLGGTIFAINEFSSPEHVGTHMDAPFHTNETKWTIDDIPIDHLTFLAAVIDISNLASKDGNATIKLEDIEIWEKQNGLIPNGSVVFMYSGWGKFWQNTTAYLGVETTGNPLYPGFEAEVCKWLVKERSIFGIGVDTISGDPGYSSNFPCHTILFDNNLFILENVANLDKLPAVGATVRAYPMKIKGGTGAPTRIIASI